ncbi:MAG: hypothetical protein PUA50_01225 [Eubacteriales bacterium]|nr:hypothetical protein [Eubacteriales bacterium]
MNVLKLVGNKISKISLPIIYEKSRNPNATYVCVSAGESFCPSKIVKRSVCIDADIGETLRAAVGS